MMVIGLTGGIASGKSTVAAMLEKAHIPVIDADDLAKRAVMVDTPGFREIIETFGPTILKDDGTIDRTKLARLVFSDAALLGKLEAIIHPKIKKLAEEKLHHYQTLGHSVVVYMAPLLFEKNLHKNCDKTLLVTANKEIRKARLFSRDQLLNEEAEERFKFQLSDDEKAKLADEIIENNESLFKLYKNLSTAWKKLTNYNLPISY